MSTIKATIIKKQNNINDNNENINNLSICPNSSLRPLSSSPGSLSSLCWNKISTKMNFQEVSYWPNTTTWSFTSVRTLAASKSVSTGRPLRYLVMVEWWWETYSSPSMLQRAQCQQGGVCAGSWNDCLKVLDFHSVKDERSLTWGVNGSVWTSDSLQSVCTPMEVNERDLLCCIASICSCSCMYVHHVELR